MTTKQSDTSVENKITVEIDGQAIQAEQGSMVIEAADAAGIYIPRFCYHKKLSVAANCRMCLVEVANAPKPLPACATPVAEGMRILTHSDKAREAQQSVMEFLLINHPLDCPICDQGGECELQDVALEYGKDVSRYSEGKRVVKDKNLGGLISTDMTRCIHCTRCVRFGQEIAGMQELGATGRGEHTVIGTFIEQNVESEISGNVIDLCPVGALTAKPYRFTARAWELSQKTAVSPHDCWGSNLYLHTREDQVKRVVPKDNESINETWISDRDRFSYESVHAETRLLTPVQSDKTAWQPADWQQALPAATDKLGQIISAHGSDQVGVILSPSLTAEDYYLAKKLVDSLGIKNVDYNLIGISETVRPAPFMGMPISDMEHVEAALLVGADVRRDVPLAAVRLRKAAQQGGKIFAIHDKAHDWQMDVAGEFVESYDNWVAKLAGVASALSKNSELGAEQQKQFKAVSEWVSNVPACDLAVETAEALKASGKTLVVLGEAAQVHPQASALHSLVSYITALLNGASDPLALKANLGVWTKGANQAAAYTLGVHPFAAKAKAGLTVNEMLSADLKAYVVIGVEPESDFVSDTWKSAFENADLVCLFSTHKNEAAAAYADWCFPIVTFAETGGTYANVNNIWQTTKPAIKPVEAAKPLWKVLRVIGNLLDKTGFDYETLDAVTEAMREKIAKTTLPEQAICSDWCSKIADVTASSSIAADNAAARSWFSVERHTLSYMYQIDVLTRQSKSLQAHVA